MALVNGFYVWTGLLGYSAWIPGCAGLGGYWAPRLLGWDKELLILYSAGLGWKQLYQHI
uniref:Uncharacterized protein n=1 Tax=Picea glauca TaxID=3330 RepID=A0A101M2K7_PICGL|nr:hypothetical protein ABT39_MTgene3082 [Picea glauca]QHR87305.1 hypothetical protein Q903MT_gene1315 [Picea sitchensis]